MTLLQTLILAIVQGVTEFLPISSSGHLNLLQHLFGVTPSLTFDIFLNTATLLSVLFFFRKKLSYFFSHLGLILLASIPAGLVGVLLKHQIESIFSDVKLLPYFFLITSAFVLSTKFIKSKPQKLTALRAFFIGLIQAVAILPAVSRSGSTISTGVNSGLSSEEAFDFSFCLFIPASFGAILLDARKMSASSLMSPTNLIAFVVCFLVGILSLSLLRQALIKQKFWYFGIYTLVLAIVTFFLV